MPQVQIYCVTIILSFKSLLCHVDPIKDVFEEKKLDEYTTVCYSQDNSACSCRVYMLKLVLLRSFFAAEPVMG